MAKLVTLSKDVTLNGKSYPKGQKISVTDSLFAKLTKDGAVGKDDPAPVAKEVPAK